jgi:hypothetical protein
MLRCTEVEDLCKIVQFVLGTARTVLFIFVLGRRIEMDEIVVLKQVLTQGPFAALFVWLLWSTEGRGTRTGNKVDGTG